MRGTAARWALFGFAVFLVAFAVRIANLDSAFVRGAARIPPADDLYHARRIVHSALRFPRVLDLDPDRGVGGAFCPWPPLYDLAAGGAARLLGGGDQAGVVARAVWFPPLFSALFAAAASVFVGSRLGLGAAGIAASGIALSPNLVAISRIGSLDHHFLEGPLACGVALGVWYALRSAHPQRAGLVLGLAVSVALLVQTALIVAAVLAALALLGLTATRSGPALSGAIGLGLAALTVAGYRLTRAPGYPDGEWFLGWAHVAVLLGAAVACGVAATLRARGRTGLGTAVLAAAAGGAIALSVPGFATAAVGGARFFGGDPWLSTIQEFTPLFTGANAIPHLDLLLLGGPALLVPLFVRRAFLRFDSGTRAVALFAAVFLLAALSSRRFLSTGLPLFAAAAAWVVADLGRRPGARAAAVAVVLVPAGIASWLWLRNPGPTVPPSAHPLIRAGQAIRQHPREPGGGRVLGPWSWGHLLGFASGHPVVIDNFGAALGRPLFEDALSVLLQCRDEHVARWCASHGVRFLVLENPAYFARSAERMLGSAGLYDASGAPTRRLQATFWWRAFFATGERPELDGFRRLYSDSLRYGGAFEGPAVEVWELVPGRGA